MKLELWRLTGSHFHFGEQGLGQEETRPFWSSDSLFSALVARLALLHGAPAVDAWMQPFLNGSPPFLLTSLFPLAGEVRFFPLPLAAGLPDARPLPEGMRAKDLKKVQFVSEGLYHRLLDGETLVNLAPTRRTAQKGSLWLTAQEFAQLPHSLRQQEDPRLWEVEKRSRVTVGRAPETSTLFHVGAVHFAQDCGLWFGVHWLDPNAPHKSSFAHLLNDLGEAGLGAERSVGYGKGTFTPLSPLQLPDPLSMWTTLSRYLPRQEEMDAFRHPRAAWKIQVIGGWLDSPQKRGQRRRAINLVQEGATLGMPANTRPPFGYIADVRPRYKQGPEYPIEHPVYRSGLAVAVGYGGET